MSFTFFPSALPNRPGENFYRNVLCTLIKLEGEKVNTELFWVSGNGIYLIKLNSKHIVGLIKEQYPHL